MICTHGNSSTNVYKSRNPRIGPRHFYKNTGSLIVNTCQNHSKPTVSWWVFPLNPSVGHVRSRRESMHWKVPSHLPQTAASDTAGRFHQRFLEIFERTWSKVKMCWIYGFLAGQTCPGNHFSWTSRHQKHLLMLEECELCLGGMSQARVNYGVDMELELVTMSKWR